MTDGLYSQLVVERGEMHCEYLGKGANAAEVISSSVEYGGLTQREAELLLSQAVVGLCTEHMAAVASPTAVGISEGVYLVGTDIEPGTYRSEGGLGRPCYWERLSDSTDPMNQTIDNGLTNGPSVVTISPDDFAFETGGCEPWTQVE